MTAGALLAIVITVLFADLPGSSRFVREMQDTAHTVAFALIAWLLAKLLSAGSGQGARTHLAAFAWCFVLACGTEALQYLLGRDASLGDVGRDLLGALTLLCALSSSGRPSAGRRQPWLRTVALMSALVALAPMTWMFTAYIHRARVFPVLAEFHSRLDSYFLDLSKSRYSTELTAEAATRGELYVPIDTPPWPGVSIDEPYPRWRGFAQLAIRVTNPNPRQLTLMLRVHDLHHTERFDDRLNTSVILPAESTTTWRIPVSQIESAPSGRKMDLDHMANLKIFASTPNASKAFIVHKIWLE